MNTFKSTFFALALAYMTFLGYAYAAEPKASELGKSLTPLGGEVSGNADGSIPDWTGGLTEAPEGYTEGGSYIDPFEDEQPLFIIYKANMADHEERLTAGQIALLNAYPETFNIPVYKTHRTAANPEWVYKNVRENALNASITSTGTGVVGVSGGVPFPIPNSGSEIIWNHMFRFFGVNVERTSADIVAQANGSYSTSIINVERFSPFYLKEEYDDDSDILYYYRGNATSPARIAGDVFLIHEPINHFAQPRRAWIYNSGQRRVRRAPVLAYDTPVGSSEGLRTTDDTDMFNGALNRFDWRLVEKKEIYIPYNNYKLLDKNLAYSDIIHQGHLNPDHTRYELHRVWKVEATLKGDSRHIYSRRTFYVDEDSWSIASVDQYDARGELWRVSMAYLVNYYNLPAVLSSVDVFHDLNSRRYQAQGLANEEQATIRFSNEPSQIGAFTPSNLSRFSGR